MGWGLNMTPLSVEFCFVIESMATPLFRNLLAFWIFGLTNNFPYVIMLSAAHDILDDPESNQVGKLLLTELLTSSCRSVITSFTIVQSYLLYMENHLVCT